MSATVTVACKIPNGIVIRGMTPQKYEVPVLGMPDKMETRQRFVPDGRQAVIKGNAIASPMNGPRGPQPGGFALTHGVDKALWEAWKAANADSDIVKNNLIFAHEKKENTAAEAKEHRAAKSGLEPLDTSMTTKDGKSVPSDPRIPKRIKRDDKKIEDDE